MRAIQFEFVLKGVFLGLWAAAALRQPPGEPRWADLLTLILWTVVGLGIGLVVASGQQLLRGVKPKGNPLAYLVYLLLEGSFWVYLGLVGGCAAGLLYGNATNPDLPRDRNWLGYCVVAGAVLGYGFLQLRQVKDWRWRFGLGAAVGAGLVYVATLYLDEAGWLEPSARRTIGLFLLAGLPFFYLLTFCGVAEESEVEIAALCAGMGLGIHLLRFPENVPAIGFLLPVGLYFLYVTKYIAGLRGFKHTLRGFGYLNVGRIREALVCFRRARQINPKNALANDGLIRVHQRVDLVEFENDPDTLALLDYGFCLDRAETLLISDRTPGEAALAEAGRMLELVERQQPRFAPRAAYLRALWLTYAKRFDDAAATLKGLLDPAVPADPAIRNAVLFPAWDLALRLHPELVKRLGEPELALPGRRIEAIAATQRVLAVRPDDGTANELKALLYAGLSESEFLADKPTSDFNFDYVEQLGLALIDEADADRRERGAAFLRIAGHGLPARGPSIFQKLAEATVDPEAARGYREQVIRAAMAFGVKSLAADQRAIYFDSLGKSVAEAEARNDFAAAAADQRLVLESGKNDLENYRKLADLYEKAGDPLNALLSTETALIYSGKDAELLARKDKYYYSVTPDRVAAVKDKIESLFDVNYCVTKANVVLNQREPDADTLDWGQHLARLARTVKPDLLAAILAEGRLLLRRGEREQGLSLLEDVREAKASGGDEKEAWYTATRILGDLYLNELNRPDLALACFTDYKEHPKSGADTLFHIAACYEATGDVKNATRFYEAVTAYEGHPRYFEATEAVRRLKG